MKFVTHRTTSTASKPSSTVLLLLQCPGSTRCTPGHCTQPTIASTQIQCLLSQPFELLYGLPCSSLSAAGQPAIALVVVVLFALHCAVTCDRLCNATSHRDCLRRICSAPGTGETLPVVGDASTTLANDWLQASDRQHVALCGRYITR